MPKGEIVRQKALKRGKGQFGVCGAVKKNPKYSFLLFVQCPLGRNGFTVVGRQDLKASVLPPSSGSPAIREKKGRRFWACFRSFLGEKREKMYGFGIRLGLQTSFCKKSLYKILTIRFPLFVILFWHDWHPVIQTSGAEDSVGFLYVRISCRRCPSLKKVS